LCREAWGARPPRPGGTPQIPSRITIHRTAVILGDNSNAPIHIRADQRDFDEEEVTEELLTGVALASAWAAHHFFISPDTLSGHRDFAATSCPGANVYAHIASGENKRRIDDLWPAAPGTFSGFVGRRPQLGLPRSRQATDSLSRNASLAKLRPRPALTTWVADRSAEECWMRQRASCA
jgi:hypothetical protein